jgi:hypothetical protein
MKSHPSLPANLRFLQPFVNRLAKLSSDRLDENVDASPLEAALRKRIRGLDVRQARTRLDDDRRVLESWLKASASSEHPAHWVLGFLASRGLAGHLLAPPEKPAPVPRVHFEPPAGWEARREVKSGSLNCRKGRLYAGISAMDKAVFESTLLFGFGPARESEVQFGAAKGKKFVRRGSEPVVKQLDYCLAVPGGFVMILLTGPIDRDFDEAPFEAQLHTLRVSESA